MTLHYKEHLLILFDRCPKYHYFKQFKEIYQTNNVNATWHAFFSYHPVHITYNWPDLCLWYVKRPLITSFQWSATLKCLPLTKVKRVRTLYYCYTFSYVTTIQLWHKYVIWHCRAGSTLAQVIGISQCHIWFRAWLKAITWTNVDLSLEKFYSILTLVISQQVQKLISHITDLKIILLKLLFTSPRGQYWHNFYL